MTMIPTVRKIQNSHKTNQHIKLGKILARAIQILWRGLEKCPLAAACQCRQSGTGRRSELGPLGLCESQAPCTVCTEASSGWPGVYRRPDVGVRSADSAPPSAAGAPRPTLHRRPDPRPRRPETTFPGRPFLALLACFPLIDWDSPSRGARDRGAARHASPRRAAASSPRRAARSLQGRLEPRRLGARAAVGETGPRARIRADDPAGERAPKGRKRSPSPDCSGSAGSTRVSGPDCALVHFKSPSRWRSKSLHVSAVLTADGTAALSRASCRPGRRRSLPGQKSAPPRSPAAVRPRRALFTDPAGRSPRSVRGPEAKAAGRVRSAAPRGPAWRRDRRDRRGCEGLVGEGVSACERAEECGGEAILTRPSDSVPKTRLPLSAASDGWIAAGFACLAGPSRLSAPVG